MFEEEEEKAGKIEKIVCYKIFTRECRNNF